MVVCTRLELVTLSHVKGTRQLRQQTIVRTNEILLELRGNKLYILLTKFIFPQFKEILGGVQIGMVFELSIAISVMPQGRMILNKSMSLFTLIEIP